MNVSAAMTKSIIGALLKTKNRGFGKAARGRGLLPCHVGIVRRDPGKYGIPTLTTDTMPIPVG